MFAHLLLFLSFVFVGKKAFIGKRKRLLSEVSVRP
jgi:hypothetical protein